MLLSTEDCRDGSNATDVVIDCSHSDCLSGAVPTLSLPPYPDHDDIHGVDWSDCQFMRM